ncbi:MAG: 16S rRNA (cytidine(1402)-2'-O)-methyltransferase [Oscillospiraceae bacterium]
MIDTTENGRLLIVATPIGNLSDFSPRGIEALENADYIACEDTRVSLRLLTHFGIKKPLLSYYKPHEQEKSVRILELLAQGSTVALVSDAGMPCISDPGVYLVQKCCEVGIEVEVIPGCNAAVAAVAVSGIDTARFAFEGFLPVPKKERQSRLAEIKALPHTLIFYEAPHKLRNTLADLAEALGGGRNAAVCRELTKVHEEIIRATLDELNAYYTQAEPRGEFVIVVEGAGEITAEELTPEQAAELAQSFVDGGERLSDACKRAADISGVSKREIYRLLTADK